jgi:hypothetical protein
MPPTIDAKPVKEEKGQPRDQEKKNGLGKVLPRAIAKFG